MMSFRKRVSRKDRGEAVSPVVGVMLMLVITIIVAAVVSAFAGSTMSGTQKAPTASIEFHVRNGGTAVNSYISMNILSVSEPIQTKNLRLITTWTTTDKNPASSTYQYPITGGFTSNGTAAAYVSGDLSGSSGPFAVPTGYGNGVMNWSNDSFHTPESQWGNFTLTSGTSTFDRPDNSYGSGTNGAYFYSGTVSTDPMQAILGSNWNNLRVGDTVVVRLVDMASGKTIIDKNVIVEGP